MIGLRFFPLKSADVSGAGTRDEPLRTSAGEAIMDPTKSGSILGVQKDKSQLTVARVGAYLTWNTMLDG